MDATNQERSCKHPQVGQPGEEPPHDPGSGRPPDCNDARRPPQHPGGGGGSLPGHPGGGGGGLPGHPGRVGGGPPGHPGGGGPPDLPGGGGHQDPKVPNDQEGTKDQQDLWGPMGPQGPQGIPGLMGPGNSMYPQTQSNTTQVVMDTTGLENTFQWVADILERIAGQQVHTTETLNEFVREQQ